MNLFVASVTCTWYQIAFNDRWIFDGNFLVYDDMENISMDTIYKNLDIFQIQENCQSRQNSCVYSLLSKNADWNQQQLMDGGILANRNSTNHPFFFLANQKEVQILAFFACDLWKNCIMPSSRKQI